MIQIKIRDLGHEYDGRAVFRSINFCFDGDALAVTGPNGSGKSTLLRIIAGLLTPARGGVELLIDGGVAPRGAVRHAVGLAAPDLPLYAELSTRENLLFLTAARTGRADRDATQRALSQLGLLDRADDPFGELSSGLKRRACLAAAIVHSPPVLLLDEPCANLDEEGIRAVRSVMEDQRLHGMLVVATNDSRDAEGFSGKIDLGVVS